MKRFLVNISIMVFLLWGTLYLCIRKANYGAFQLSALLDKHRRLDSLNDLRERKIIIIGGSNCLFGFNSSEIQAYFHRPVANLGLHAGLGLKFMLNDCMHFVRPGDVVLLSPEYLGFIGKTCDGESVLNELIYGVYPKGLRDLDPSQYGHFFSNTGQFVQDLLTRPVTQSSLRTRFYGSDIKEVIAIDAVINRRSSVDSLGDLFEPAALDSLARPDWETISGEINPDAIRCVVRFKEAVASRGATLVILPQSLARMAFDASKGTVMGIDSALRAAGVPFQAGVERYVFDGQYIFNTANHLNLKGREIRTARVIQDLDGLIPR